ncbi:MAG TPA: AgmX/PglI C-terminal domain-containing protein [Polyangiaceae bacterium]|nr:AgmX/PglI C-terminal domain-containing protein [Polyangiaceae bacterium]
MTQQPFAGGPIPSGRPGQMTAVMRAMSAAAGPKVLRIGLVQSGKVIEERVIKQRSHVTIGPSEKSMFVVPSQSVPPSFRLFELIGNEYHLNFIDGMSGRVALQTGITDLAALRGQAKRSAQGAYQVRLTEDARGKVVVGETTFLFQFVAPPPIQPKPQLPVSVKGGLSNQIDWTMTIIAAFSFLFHFGMVGAIYSDWMDPVVDEELNIAGLIDSVKSLPPPPPVETPQEATTATATATATAEAPKAASGGAKPAPGAGKAGSMSTGERARLSAQLDQLEMATLGALNSAGPATAGVLKGGDVPTGALDAAAQSGAGVSAGGTGGLNLGGGGGGVVRPGMSGGGLGAIGATTAGTPGGAGPGAVVAGPKGNANVGGAEVRGGSVSNADRVVAGMRAGFRACYNRGLASNPDLQGSVRVTAKIGPNGEVLSATPSGGSGLGDEVVSCVVRRVQSATFSPPEGGGATVVIPVTFALQK